MDFKQVFFDFDSTLVHEETLDLLARKKGVGEEVSALTAMSMEGSVPVEQVFRRKMRILAPSRAELQDFGSRCERLLTRDAALLVEALGFIGKEVYILSSGFHEIIDCVAARLSIPPERVFANRIIFDAEGQFADILDTEVPIAPDGKARALRAVPSAKAHGVMVGDAVTDLAAAPEVSLFVGFGGVARRRRVEEEAPVYIACPSLCPLLRVVASPEELAALHGSEKFKYLARRAKRFEKYVKRK